MAIKLMLRAKEDGSFVPATPTDLRIALERCKPGVAMWHDIKQPRSVQQNRWLHALVEKAWHQQPGNRWESPAYLKACALVAVGHKATAEMPLGEGADPEPLWRFAEQFIKAAWGEERFAFGRRTEKGIAVDVPLHWSFDALGHDEATRIVQEVADWLCSEDGPCPGTTPEEIFAALEDPQ